MQAAAHEVLTAHLDTSLDIFLILCLCGPCFPRPTVPLLYLDLLAEGHIAFEHALLDCLLAAQWLGSVACCKLCSGRTPAPSTTPARLCLPSGLSLDLLLRGEQQDSHVHPSWMVQRALQVVTKSPALGGMILKQTYLGRSVCCRCSNLCLPLAESLQSLLEILCHVLVSSILRLSLDDLCFTPTCGC